MPVLDLIIKLRFTFPDFGREVINCGSAYHSEVKFSQWEVYVWHYFDSILSELYFCAVENSTMLQHHSRLFCCILPKCLNQILYRQMSRFFIWLFSFRTFLYVIDCTIFLVLENFHWIILEWLVTAQWFVFVFVFFTLRIINFKNILIPWILCW